MTEFLRQKPLRLFVAWCAVFAVFVLLSGCGDDPTAPEVLPESDLLTDEELVTEEDPGAPPVQAAWQDWIEANNVPVRSLVSKDFSDLQFLRNAIQDRRLVQLGEGGHGVSECDAVKARVIEFLHKEMEFDVIAFESSLYECFHMNGQADLLDAIDLMKGSIFGVWHATEVLPLFDYIKATQHTSRPLILAGFDVQISSFRGVAGRYNFFRDIIAPIDAVFAAQVAVLDSVFLDQYISHSQAFASYIDGNAALFTKLYQDVADFIDQHEDALINTHGFHRETVLIARQTALSMIVFVKEWEAFPDLGLAIFLRDEGMANNIDFLVEEMFPGKKIIVWAHNFHIRHNHLEVSLDSYSGRTMGTWVAERHRDDLYTVGLYMYRGHAAWNDRTVYPIANAIEGSLESIGYRARRKFFFVDMLAETQNEGNSWMFERIFAKTWGVPDLSMVPRDQYDAILFVDTVNPPNYIDHIHVAPGVAARGPFLGVPFRE